MGPKNGRWPHTGPIPETRYPLPGGPDPLPEDEIGPHEGDPEPF